jgi:uncharacterized membrane protein
LGVATKEDEMRDVKPLAAVLGVLAIVALITAGTTGVLVATMGPGMMWWGPPPSGFGWRLAMGGGSLFLIAFGGAVILSAALLFRWAAAGAGDTREEPFRILGRRYATGEIDAETYDRMRHDLAA